VETFELSAHLEHLAPNGSYHPLPHCPLSVLCAFAAAADAATTTTTAATAAATVAAASKLAAVLPRVHGVLLGPGLGRHPCVLDVAAGLVDQCRAARLPLVVRGAAERLGVYKQLLSQRCLQSGAPCGNEADLVDPMARGPEERSCV